MLKQNKSWSTPSAMITVALIGNPNSGKSTLFNLLAGTKQKVGNYPGVTVDIKSAIITLPGAKEVELLDMPGLYSMYPSGAEERLVVDSLMGIAPGKQPDIIVYTVDASNLEAQLLLYTQLIDLGYPVLLVINMIDELEKENLAIDIEELRKRFGTPVMSISGRTGENIDELQDAIGELIRTRDHASEPFYRLPSDQVDNVRYVFFDSQVDNHYGRLLQLHHQDRQGTLSKEQIIRLDELTKRESFQSLPAQVDETMERAERIKRMISFAIVRGPGRRFDSNWFDRFLTHKYVGPVIFVLLMLFVFQAIFAWATYPMDWIEGGMAWLSGQVSGWLPDNWFSSLITDGLIPGLSGVLVFVPQIAILFS